MKYEIYIDVFILMNFAMDLLALILTNIFLNRRKNFKTLILASVLGAIIGALLFLKMDNYMLYVTCIHFCINPIMLYIAFREKNRKEFLEDWVVCYIVVILSGGVMQWLYVSMFHNKNLLLCVGITFGIGLLTIGIWEKQMVIGRRIYDVKIIQGQVEICLKAYYDTGNILMDPFMNEPVSMISKEMLEKITNENMLPFRLIPFHSVGAEHGLIEAVTLDEMHIYRKKNVVKIRPAVLGIAQNTLFEQTNYQMILNSHLLHNTR